MAEGLEVIIKYRGAKYDQVSAPATLSSEFAILKKDLAHLRVHSPSQKNVRRVNGSFILHWPTAGTSPKVAGLADSLHTRWSKLCSDDPEALKLREFLSIGAVVRSTTGAEQASQDAPPGTLAGRLGDSLSETGQQPEPVPSLSLPTKPQLPIPPPRIPPTAPRSDRQQIPHLKRRMSSSEGPSNSTRQKLDAPEVPGAAPSINTQLQQTLPPTSPLADRQRGSSASREATTKASPQPAQDDTVPPAHAQTPIAPEPPDSQTIPTSPPREPGEIQPVPIPTSASGPPTLGSSPRPPPPPNNPTPHTPAPASPYQGSSPGNSDSYARSRRDRDVNRLTRELWDTRRQVTAMQAREHVILDDLERLGARPESTGADRNGVSRDELLRLEADLRMERARRVHAERALSDVERECRAPFVVPALFQAFMSISELSK